MTTFSCGVKNTVCAVKSSADEKVAELFGMLYSCDRFDERGILFVTENEHAMDRFCLLLRKICCVDSTSCVRKGGRGKRFIFEGGAIESDGEGTLLTTAECLLSPNRNAQMSKDEIEKYLLDTLHSKRVLWLNNGFLQGDDTDSHIDTLARLCPDNTIVYVQCTDKEDVHYEALMRMEQELKEFRTLDGKPYRLLPLPMALPAYEGEERLPATYANFLIINGAVLLPIYGTERDAIAVDVMKMAFPNHEIVTVNCSPLIRQHGSLHCVTMQYPE